MLQVQEMGWPMSMLRKLFLTLLFLSIASLSFAAFPPVNWLEQDGSPSVFPTKVRFPNTSLNNTATGLVVTFVGVEGGSGDVTDVGDCAGGICLDGTSDGGTWIKFYDAQGAGQLITGNLTAARVWTLPDITGTLLTLGEIDTFAELDAIVVDNALVNKEDGAVWLGVHDFGGATSTEIVNGADLILDAGGEVGVNTTHKGFAWYDGTQEVFSPSIHTLQGSLGTGDYDSDADVKIIELDSDSNPHGIVITSWEVECNEADPTTELNANIYYCDDQSTGAFPGANAVLIDVIDTTTGNSSETNMALSNLGSGIIPTGKTLYILIDADLVSDTTLFSIKIKFYVPES